MARNLQQSEVVVLGGAGFIGSHIVDELLRTDVGQVVVFDNFTRGRRENLQDALHDNRVRVVEGDITHTDVLNAALEGADVVFHLAALWLLHCQEFPRAAFEVNVAGTFNVLEACRNQRVQRLVYSSSASVYGDAVEVPMTESHPLANRTFYGATKIAGEQMCRAFHEQYGLPFVGLRYMNVYGPRQPGNEAYSSVIIKMLEELDQGRGPVIHGDGTQVYDFVHVADVARANVLALTSGTPDSFYNVGTGRGTTLTALAELLVDLTGSSAGVRHIAAERRAVSRRVGSTELARRDLGFEAAISVREGLRDLIEWRAQDHDDKEGIPQ